MTHIAQEDCREGQALLTIWSEVGQAAVHQGKDGKDGHHDGGGVLRQLLQLLQEAVRQPGARRNPDLRMDFAVVSCRLIINDASAMGKSRACCPPHT